MGNWRRGLVLLLLPGSSPWRQAATGWELPAETGGGGQKILHEDDFLSFFQGKPM